MNANQWSYPQRRLSCAVAAMLASTLVMSSVLWLFARADVAAANLRDISGPDRSEGFAVSHRIDAGHTRNRWPERVS